MSVKLFRTDNQITDANGKFFAVGDFNSNEWISKEDLVAGLPFSLVSEVSNQTELDQAITDGNTIIKIIVSGTYDITNLPTQSTIITNVLTTLQCNVTNTGAGTEYNVKLIGDNAFITLVNLSAGDGNWFMATGNSSGLTLNEECGINGGVFGQVRQDSMGATTGMKIRYASIGYYWMIGSVSGTFTAGRITASTIGYWRIQGTITLTESTSSAWNGTYVGFCEAITLFGDSISDQGLSFLNQNIKKITFS